MRVRLLTTNKTYFISECQIVLPIQNCDVGLARGLVSMDASTFLPSTSVAVTTPPPVAKPDYDVSRYIYFYGLSIILPVGLLCNILCFAVFLSSRGLRRTTTGHYLIALAVADTIFLLGELFR